MLEAVRTRRLEPVASWELARELVDVLRRPSIRRYGVTEGDVEDLLAIIGPLLPDVDVSVAIRDPDDAPVVTAALAGRATAIVTGDRDILDDHALRVWLARHGADVLTPAQAVASI